MRNCLASLALVLALASPALAASLPDTANLRSPKDLQAMLEQIEDEALAAGAPKKAVYGSTAKLANFLEDSVLTTGRAVTLHPTVFVGALVGLAQEGLDKTAIANKLIELQKARRL